MPGAIQIRWICTRHIGWLRHARTGTISGFLNLCIELPSPRQMMVIPGAAHVVATGRRVSWIA